MRKYLHKIQLWGIFLLRDYWERAHPIVGTISGLMALGSIRKQADQAMLNKSVSNTLQQPLHQFLLLVFCPVKILVLIAMDDEL